MAHKRIHVAILRLGARAQEGGRLAAARDEPSLHDGGEGRVRVPRGEGEEDEDDEEREHGEEGGDEEEDLDARHPRLARALLDECRDELVIPVRGQRAA